MAVADNTLQTGWDILIIFRQKMRISVDKFILFTRCHSLSTNLEILICSCTHSEHKNIFGMHLGVTRQELGHIEISSAIL